MQFNIGEKLISATSEPFIIAEAGINHNGQKEKMIEMVDIAKSCGADCIKFQTFKAAEFCCESTALFTYKSQGKFITESQLDLFKRVEVDENTWQEVKQYCDDKKIIFMSTPQNTTDLDLLLKIGIPAIKVGSDDFVNLPLLKYYKSKNLPLILSCGMADLDEIKKVLTFIDYKNISVALLLCTSQYPTPLKDVNLNKLKTLRKEFPDLILGFSDHTQGTLAAGIAMGLNAVIFEKHFTLSHDLPGPDHWFSANPKELKDWIETIKNAYTIMGQYEVYPTEEELISRETGRRKIMASCEIKKGEIFNETNLVLKRSQGGFNGLHYYEICGGKALKDIPAGKSIEPGDF